MGKRKFEVGDKVKVKNFRVRGADAEGVKERVGKVGTIQSYSPNDDYPYNVEFDNLEIEDMLFKASELEKVEEEPLTAGKLIVDSMKRRGEIIVFDVEDEGDK